VPVPGFTTHPERTYQTEQSARLDVTETRTSLTAGQTLSTSDDKWLRKVGAEQELFGGVSITGSIGETGGRHNQQERHRQLQEELVNCRLFACFERPLPTAEMSSIAATRPRCGQIRPHR